jgi:hypothetical protein
MHENWYCRTRATSKRRQRVTRHVRLPFWSRNIRNQFRQSGLKNETVGIPDSPCVKHCHRNEATVRHRTMCNRSEPAFHTHPRTHGTEDRDDVFNILFEARDRLAAVICIDEKQMSVPEDAILTHPFWSQLSADRQRLSNCLSTESQADDVKMTQTNHCSFLPHRTTQPPQLPSQPITRTAGNLQTANG